MPAVGGSRSNCDSVLDVDADHGAGGTSDSITGFNTYSCCADLAAGTTFRSGCRNHDAGRNVRRLRQRNYGTKH